MLISLLLAALVVLAIPLPILLRYRARMRRQLTLSRMLDLADEVEALLDRSQQRMAAMRPLAERVPADIAAEAAASLQGALPIREAKRDVLQHRLWIQQNSDSAEQVELDKACAALARVRDRLNAQISELEHVGSDLASATNAAAEAALREPPTLRRNPEG